MRIETERIQLELDGRTGVIKELRSALTGWSLQRRGEVALSWKLLGAAGGAQERPLGTGGAAAADTL